MTDDELKQAAVDLQDTLKTWPILRDADNIIAELVRRWEEAKDANVGFGWLGRGE